MTALSLEQVLTPALILDQNKLDANIKRMHERLDQETDKVVLRPHLKTAKCIEIAHRVIKSPTGPITVSSLMEAEQFAAAGITDILYAVGIAPAKLSRVIQLHQQGANVCITTDNKAAAQATAIASSQSGIAIPVLIEIDSDGHRSGIQYNDKAALLAIAEILHQGGANLRGVMTHAGGSYSGRSRSEIQSAANYERQRSIESAGILRQAGHSAPVVSIGSTPTAFSQGSLKGISEIRAGVFTFFDLVMAGLGICKISEIAISVLTTVIGHQREKGWIIVDSGWMAMSRDRGTASQAIDQGYGLVCNINGLPYTDLIMSQTNQEHGIISIRPGSKNQLPDLPVGTLLRILPNHACATAAQHQQYHVMQGHNLRVDAIWPRFNGW